jgi:hypothetical protein
MYMMTPRKVAFLDVFLVGLPSELREKLKGLDFTLQIDVAIQVVWDDDVSQTTAGHCQ